MYLGTIAYASRASTSTVSSLIAIVVIINICHAGTSDDGDNLFSDGHHRLVDNVFCFGHGGQDHISGELRLIHAHYL